VLVVSINPAREPAGHGGLPDAAIARHLARHGLDVEAQPVETDAMEVGEALLAFAAERACDLLVMGAYAHSRMRELVLGGATRTVLKKMTLPVLMAH
jgi:nucleotide-binding universal stress UspA family protein